MNLISQQFEIKEKKWYKNGVKFSKILGVELLEAFSKC
jgi:hypothetical protein